MFTFVPHHNFNKLYFTILPCIVFTYFNICKLGTLFCLLVDQYFVLLYVILSLGVFRQSHPINLAGLDLLIFLLLPPKVIGLLLHVLISICHECFHVFTKMLYQSTWQNNSIGISPKDPGLHLATGSVPAVLK